MPARRISLILLVLLLSVGLAHTPASGQQSSGVSAREARERGERLQKEARKRAQDAQKQAQRRQKEIAKEIRRRDREQTRQAKRSAKERKRQGQEIAGRMRQPPPEGDKPDPGSKPSAGQPDAFERLRQYSGETESK